MVNSIPLHAAFRIHPVRGLQPLSCSTPRAVYDIWWRGDLLQPDPAAAHYRKYRRFSDGSGYKTGSPWEDSWRWVGLLPELFYVWSLPDRQSVPLITAPLYKDDRGVWITLVHKSTIIKPWLLNLWITVGTCSWFPQQVYCVWIFIAGSDMTPAIFKWSWKRNMIYCRQHLLFICCKDMNICLCL